MKYMILMLANLCFAKPAFAEQATPPPPMVSAAPIDPAAIAAARTMLLATGAEEQLQDLGRRSSAMMFDMMMRETQQRVGETLPEALVERMRAVTARNSDVVMRDLKATFIDDIAAIYARYFTADEIVELQRLQTNPVMVKFRRVLPTFLPETMQIGIAAAERHMPEMQAEMKATVEAWMKAHPAKSAARALK